LDCIHSIRPPAKSQLLASELAHVTCTTTPTLLTLSCRVGGRTGRVKVFTGVNSSPSHPGLCRTRELHITP
jgi:hypothetical protein